MKKFYTAAKFKHLRNNGENIIPIWLIKMSASIVVPSLTILQIFEGVLRTVFGFLELKSGSL